MRNLVFHLPAIVPLAPNVRMVQDDPSYTSLYDIYEDHCDSVHMHKDDPLVYFVEKFKNNVNARKEVSVYLGVEMNENLFYVFYFRLLIKRLNS